MKLVFNNFLKGAAPLDVLNLNGTNVFGVTENVVQSDHEFYSAIYSQEINPYRILNVLTPAPQKTNVTNMASVTDTIQNIVVRTIAGAAPDGWAIGSTGSVAKIYQLTGAKFDSITAGAFSSTTFPRTITSAKNGYDCAVININGTQYLIYTYDTATSGAANPTRYVGIYDFSTAYTSANAASDTWGTLSTGADHNQSFLPICLGSDGKYYIGSGYKLDVIDPTVAVGSAFSTNAKSIPKDYVITSIRDYKGFLVIGAHTKQGLTNAYARGKCAYFFWNYSQSGFTDVVYVDDTKVGAVYVSEKGLFTWTGEKDGYCKLREFDGSSFNTVAAFSSGVPTHNNPDSYRGVLIWGAGTDGKVWSYGSPIEGFPNALNYLDSGATGCVKVLSTQTGYHYHIAGAATLKTADTGYLGGAIWQTIQFRFPEDRVSVKKIVFEFLPLASGATATLSYSKNHSATFTNLKGPAGEATISFAVDGAVTRKVFTNSIPNVQNMALKISWPDSTTNVVGITKITIYYDPLQD